MEFLSNHIYDSRTNVVNMDLVQLNMVLGFEFHLGRVGTADGRGVDYCCSSEALGFPTRFHGFWVRSTDWDHEGWCCVPCGMYPTGFVSDPYDRECDWEVLYWAQKMSLEEGSDLRWLANQFLDAVTNPHFMRVYEAGDFSKELIEQLQKGEEK